MRLKGRTGSSTNFFPVLLITGLILLIGMIIYQKTTTVTVQAKTTGETTGTTDTTRVSYAAYAGHELSIDLKKDAYNRLRTKRAEALERGLLYTSKDDLVDANVRIDGKDYSCKLRLKGDLMDHLQGVKWSFRIVLKGDEWKGMKTFSIHNSKSRAHTAEWVMHELFRGEGIIAPEYDFIKVKLNGKDLGTYAYEHHFEDQLLEKNGRDIAPILKHTDDAYWENVQAEIKPFPWVEASHIELFNKEKKSDPKFSQAFDIAKGMLDEFLDGRRSAAKVFDLELMAKYYALLDVSHAWHAQQFTNIRFYFNPLSGKLEPIAYDCFGDYLHDVTKNWEAFGEAMNDRVDKENNYQAGNVYRHLLFQDAFFSERYMSALEKYTAPNFLERVRSNYEIALSDRNRIINSDKEYTDYKLNWDKFFSKANFTFKKLQPKPALSLKAYRKNGSRTNIVMECYHGFALEILGYGDSKGLRDTLTEKTILEAYNKKVPVRQYEINNTRAVEYVYYRTLGLTEIHKTKVINVNPALRSHLRVTDLTATNDFPFLKQKDGAYVIGIGAHLIDSPIIIPPDGSLSIAAGAVLNFEGKGSLLSYGPVMAIGSAQNPIKFVSASGNAGGIMLSGATALGSRLEHCQFIGCTAYRNGHISSTAAVTLYDTEAQMEHCKFSNIGAQEALRLESSQAELSQLTFHDVQGTAILSANSAVKLSKLTLEQIGRNGLNIKSGSLEGFGYKLDGILNQSMVFTDNADIYIWDARVTDSYQALLATSHSRVILKNLYLTGVKRGLEVRGTIDPVTEVNVGKLEKSDVADLYLLKPEVVLTVAEKKVTAQ